MPSPKHLWIAAGFVAQVVMSVAWFTVVRSIGFVAAIPTLVGAALGTCAMLAGAWNAAYLDGREYQARRDSLRRHPARRKQ